MISRNQKNKQPQGPQNRHPDQKSRQTHPKPAARREETTASPWAPTKRRSGGAADANAEVPVVLLRLVNFNPMEPKAHGSPFSWLLLFGEAKLHDILVWPHDALRPPPVSHTLSGTD